MICRTGNYCILLLSLEYTSKLCPILLWGMAPIILKGKPSARQLSDFMPERTAKSSSWITNISQNISFHPQSHLQPNGSLKDVRKHWLCRSSTCTIKVALVLQHDGGLTNSDQSLSTQLKISACLHTSEEILSESQTL